MQDRQKPLLGMGFFVCLQQVKWFWTQTQDFHWEPKRNQGPSELSSRLMPSLLLCSSLCHSFKKFTISFKAQKEILDVKTEISTSPRCRYEVLISIQIEWNSKFCLTEQVSDCFNLTLHLKEPRLSSEISFSCSYNMYTPTHTKIVFSHVPLHFKCEGINTQLYPKPILCTP